MPTYTQEYRALSVTTPLGEDVLLMSALRGFESISQLFNFQLDLLAETEAEVPFDRLLGETVTVELRLPDGKARYFNGMVKRFSQGARDRDFITFQAEVVPKIWLLTRKIRSRIFQHVSVPEILRQVLAGFEVTYEITGKYYERDYCVQYRESDFDFVSRLMEEEGIHYFFKHSDGTHQMVVTDKTEEHPPVPVQPNVIFEEVAGEERDDMRVTAWRKSQELRSSEYTLWDYCFELPGNHLEANVRTIDNVMAGKVNHKLNAGNDNLEIYDYPGGYAQRFDGVDKGGAARPEDTRRIFEDRTRTVTIRMEQEEAASLEIEGTGDCGHFTAGHEFTLERHFDGNGEYLLTRVEHEAQQGDYRSRQDSTFGYQNRFRCIPRALRYRPQRVTSKPVIAGVQTATVVGPPGEEIFVDKYGRVKVQFHWDREGKLNEDSSCWIRVAQVWAGKGWGAFFWPRIGHEVVVVFEEGDPDQPMVVGSVYNAENMPWFNLPVNKRLAGIKSASERGSARQNYNGIVFNDEKGYEHLSIHSERNLSLNSESDKMIHAGRHKGERVAIASMLTVGKLIPGGGSGGGGFDEGNPMPEPPPQGIVGLNSVFTYGENLQVACPLNHQLAVGSNLQLCVNPVGLAAGVPGIPIPGIVAAVLGGGMGGSMQFTLGTSAQFTLGQSFEISVGPPKIEIHAGYGDHMVTIVLCGILGAASIVLLILYDVIGYQHWTPPRSDQEQAAERGSEQQGDKDRALLALAFQLVCDALLTAIMTAESIIKGGFWAEDDLQKLLFQSHNATFQLWQANQISDRPDSDSPWWLTWGSLAFGALGAVAVAAAEVVAVGADESSKEA